MDQQHQTILHIDMDAFFAAVEQHDRPELAGRPVVIGSPPDQRGVVATASYEARRFGIHSAMPSRTAYRLCPRAVFLPVRRERYAEVSRQIMAIFRDATPLVEPLSIDEAFLDVSGAARTLGEPVEAARTIRQRIHAETGLTASVGVAVNKFLAKLASDMDKPNGLTVVPSRPDDILAFLAPLSVRRIWGVGKATAARLHAQGLDTIADVQRLTLPEAVQLLGTGSGTHIWRLARGDDPRRVVPGGREEKSISHETTFPEDRRDVDGVRRVLLGLMEDVGRRLRASGKRAGVVHIKVRFEDFSTITRQRKLPFPSDTDQTLRRAAGELYDAERIARPIRLIGGGVDQLCDRDEPPERQLSLFEEPSKVDEERFRALDRAVDALRDRYGKHILIRGPGKP